ncbi:glycosyltransferase family 2 protein [Microlunatus flavus]|uniref:glycosyltransferase family 2 protein n=1 Tax=Microlunatus flavus TaxID=1036181 RepID=UPI001479E571|nr:glycosyltransferase [Microlunatus flavus]
MPELSIVVTTYNIEAYVEQCLESVAAQTLTDLEVLVVDDGSSDSTPAVITAFCARDPRFVPVLLPTNSPGGVATAANAGLDRATGRWLGFVDGDDFVEPTMFERLVGAAVAHDADLAMCEYAEVVDGTGERHDPADAHRWGALTQPAYVLDVETRKRFLRFIAVPWRKLYRRSVLEEQRIRFPVSEGFYEDNPFHWFTLLAARSVAVVPEVLCYHRVGRSGQTMAAADERLFQIFAHHDTIHAWLEARGLLDVYDTTLLGWVVSQMEWISKRTPPALQRRLFDTLVPIVGQYPPTTLAAALREGNKGATTQRMSAAVAKREFGSFVRRLSNRPASDNPLVTATFHLKHSGVTHTAVLTGRYVRNVLRGRRLHRVATLASRVRHHEPTRQDLMFGLVVIQQRLDGLEDHLTGIDGRLAELEAQLGEGSRPS